MTGRLSVLAATILLTTSCASSTTTPTNAPLTLHAEVTDPAGDGVVSAGVPTPPDLIHGSVDVGGGNLTVTIQFAPGTLDLSTLLTIELDTDQNPATGIVAATGVGIDYVLSLYGPTQTLIQRANPSTCASGGDCYTQVGTASLNVGTDTMSTTVPLSMRGNATGRLNYRVYAGVLAHSTTTVTTDVMPDVTLPPAHVP